MLCYRYIVKASSEEEKKVFGTTRSLVDYLNDRLNMKGVYTCDMIQNYFKPRKTRKTINPLISCLYHLTRCKADKTISSV